MFNTTLEKLLDGLSDKDIMEVIENAESMARPLPNRADYEKERLVLIVKPEDTGVFEAVHIR